MAEIFEFDPVDAIAAGAFGQPGQRTFLVQARKDGAVLSVLVEKEQVRLLAAELVAFLDRVAHDLPETEAMDPVTEARDALVVEAVPLFRARMIGLGFDPQRQLVLIELREQADDEEDDEPVAPEEAEGKIARLYATRAQVRAMAKWGADSVERGRPPCPLCQMPMDPTGHHCPRWN